MNTDRLKINEIFYSLQGESTLVGLPTIFIRLTGCPLRCHYCDTAYAFHAGNYLTIDQILEQIKDYQTPYVTVTGGEPLAQKSCLNLLSKLCDANYTVSLETSGAIDISDVDQRVIKILDLKTPGSGEEAKNHYPNLTKLTAQDQIKFVICDRDDYLWSKAMINDYQLTSHNILFSPSHQQMQLDQLAQWILDDQLPVRLQCQLHKIIWGDVAGR